MSFFYVILQDLFVVVEIAGMSKRPKRTKILGHHLLVDYVIQNPNGSYDVSNTSTRQNQLEKNALAAQKCRHR
jgi:hypothetical protein